MTRKDKSGLGRRRRDKGGRGQREAKGLLEEMGCSKVSIVHNAGGDPQGGDIWADGAFYQVKFTGAIPKALYDYVSKCDVALVRRVNAKDGKKYPWLKIENLGYLEPPDEGEEK